MSVTEINALFAYHRGRRRLGRLTPIEFETLYVAQRLARI